MKKYLAIFPILIVSVGFITACVRVTPAIFKQTFVYAVKNDSSLYFGRL